MSQAERVVAAEVEAAEVVAAEVVAVLPSQLLLPLRVPMRQRGEPLQAGHPDKTLMIN